MNSSVTPATVSTLPSANAQAAASPLPMSTPAQVPVPAEIAALPRSTPARSLMPGAVPVSPQAAAPAAAGDPLVATDRSKLQIDATRDEITSQLAASSSTTNADLYLKQGMTLSGTHYGIHLISTAGVVHVAKNARILPSATRQSRITAKKVLIEGEAVLDVIQGDSLVLFSPDARAIVGEVVYGQSLVTSEGSQMRIQRGIRTLTPRERRANHWFEAAMDAIDSSLSFEAICKHQDDEIEAAATDLVQEQPRPSLAAVTTNR